jgi:LmbE family N-acetylglucosaminyl deacetylase
MVFVDPAALFEGDLVFAAPHMDDEVLACGGTIARLPEKQRLHVVYATDGAKSPVPPFAWMGRGAADLPRIRREEARSALEILGIPEQNTHFLEFPDGELRKHAQGLRLALVSLLERIQPSYVFVPFRYDRHPDHLALRAATLQASESLGKRVQIVEYFVYYRWRLVPGGDLRRIIQPEHLVEIDISEQRDRKRRALECYASQATRVYHWQDRPILPRERVVEVSRSPELFVMYSSAYPGATIFSRLRRWIPLVHTVEPALKRRKDDLRLLMRAGRTVRADRRGSAQDAS